MPLRRVGVHYVVFGLVAFACGVAESWGSSLGLLVICIPFGFWLDRYGRPRFSYPVDVLSPHLGVVESPARTALRALIAYSSFAVMLVIGVTFPLVGSIGGGMMGGIAISVSGLLRALVLAENRQGFRVIVQVPAGLILRERTFVYYRDRP